MTIHEFDMQSFGAHMQCKYDNDICDIWSVDFGEKLIQIAPEGTDVNTEYEASRWIRCENCELIKK